MKIHFLAGTVIETETDTLPPNFNSEGLNAKSYKANMHPHKKPLGRKTFLQGSEILQVFKTAGGRRSKSN